MRVKRFEHILRSLDNMRKVDTVYLFEGKPDPEVPRGTFISKCIGVSWIERRDTDERAFGQIET